MSFTLRRAILPTLLGVAICGSPAAAFEFNYGELHGNLDSTASVGTAMRLSNRNCKLIATSNGGCNSQGINGDDGDLNFDRYDFTSAPATMTHELALTWRNFGAFTRFTYFYDPLLNNGNSMRRTDLSDSAKMRVGRGIDLLDAYAYGNFDLGGHATTIRVGQQAINWGESLFTQGGINETNPIDVSKLHQAGSDIKLATLPTPIIDLSTALAENLSLEAYYQLVWKETLTDPVGTYFSQGDLTGSGAQGFFIPGVSGGDPGAIGNAAYGIYFPKQPNRTPRNSGQWGVATRYFIDPAATEVALYYMHYHSKTPILGFSFRRVPPLAGGALPAGYFEEYASDIDLYGASFNTSIFGTGMGGEISYQPSFPVPLAVATTISTAQAGALTVPLNSTYTKSGVLWVKKWQAALTDIASFAPSTPFIGSAITAIGADSGSLASEVVANLYPNLAKGQVVYATPMSKATPSEFSWGYRFSASVSYPNAFGTGILLAPSVAFQHDVNGTVPNNPNGATFIDGRKVLTVGVTGTYLSNWKANISYTNFFGAPDGDDLYADRDYAAVSLSYSF